MNTSKTCCSYLALLILLSFGIACDKRPASETGDNTPPAVTETTGQAFEPPDSPEVAPTEYRGSFGKNAQRPVRDGAPQPVEIPTDVIEQLNATAQERIDSAFTMRQVSPDDSYVVTLGGAGESDGLLLTITHDGRSAAHHIPPATSEPELVSNLDHTTDRVLDELGVPRQ